MVHGLRGLVADVYLDGTLVLLMFQPERSTDPLPIPVGPHLVDNPQRRRGVERDAVAHAERHRAGRVRWLAVAHLNGAGQPTLTAFADDLTAVPPGESRVVVRVTPRLERAGQRGR